MNRVLSKLLVLFVISALSASHVNAQYTYATEGFETGWPTTDPGSTQINVTAGTGVWKVAKAFTVATNPVPFAGTKCLQENSTSFALTTPICNTGVGTLSFQATVNSTSNRTLTISKSTDGTAFTTVTTTANISKSNVWQSYSIPINDLTAKYIKIVGSGSGINFDEMLLTPACTITTTSYNVTASANTICSGGSVTIGLDNSQSGVTYQLYAGGSPLAGVTVIGTGAAVSFAAQNPSSATTYTVVATTAGGFCGGTINGTTASQVVAVNTAPVISTVNLAGATYTVGDNAANLQISSTGTSPAYQWFSNGSASTSGASSIGGATSVIYKPLTSTPGSTYYYCVATVTACPAATSNFSGEILVNAATNPTIILDSTSTNFDGPFGRRTVNTTSTARSFKVSGTLLTGNITVNAPSGFEVSLSSGSGFGSSVILSQSGGIVNETIVYARFTPTAATDYSANITCVSSGATTINAAVSGTGTIPAISIDQSALSFSVTGWTNSVSQNKAISGTDLDGDINVSVAAPFQVSNNNSSWSTSTSYTPSSGSVSGTLYVRYNPSSGTGTDNSTVSISSTNAAGKSFSVSGKAAVAISLSSGSSTQSVKAGVGITNIVYAVTGGVTNASASGLPSGVTFNNNTYTISGTPATEAAYPVVYNYTVTIVGPSGTSNATATGTITVKDPNAKNVAFLYTSLTPPTGSNKLYTTLNNNYSVTVLAPITAADMTTIINSGSYDLIVLHEAIGSGNLAVLELGKHIGEIPILNTKAHMYGKTNWPAGAGNNGTPGTTVSVTVATQYLSHPIFNGVSFSGNSVTMSGASGNNRWVDNPTTTGQKVIALNSTNTANAVSIMELNITSLSLKKYMLIALSAANEDLTTNGLLVMKNACDYLMTPSRSITASAGANGSITPSGTTVIDNGTSQGYTITPNGGFVVSDVLVDGGSVGAVTSYTFSNVTANHTISATFAVPCVTNNWTGSVNNNWNINGNWSCGHKPLSTESVVISSGSPHLNENFAVAGSLTLSGTASLSVDPNVILSISGTANFGGRPVTVVSNINGTGAIGRVTGTLSGESNVTVERYIPSSRRSWRLLSVPTKVSGQTIRQSWMEYQGQVNQSRNANNVPGFGTIISTGTAAQVIPGGFDTSTQYTSIRNYNGSAFVSLASVNTAIATTAAYFIYIRGDRSVTSLTGTSTSATTLRTNGTLYKGTQSAITVPANSFTLVGNIYASAINFENIVKSNISNTFYLWDAALGSTGGYETFSGTNSFKAGTGGGSWALNEVDTLIQSGQGFFVSGTATPGSVTLSESSKAYTNLANTKGLRPSAQSAISKLSTRLLVGEKAYDGNAVVFNQKYQNAIDADDALKFANPGENFAIVSGGKELAVEARQPASTESVISFSMKNMKQQVYTLEFSPSHMGAGEAFLVDNYLNTKTAISLSAATKVNFTVSADAKSAAADRFKVVFRPAAVTIEGVPAIKVSPNPLEGGNINLQFTKQVKGRYNLNLVDVTGRIIYKGYKEHAGGSANQTVTLPSGIARGAYQLVITAPDKTRQVEKIIINTNN